MTDIKTGLWQNNLDGSYIKVKNVLETYITYSDEGCAGTHVMNKREIIGCYKLIEADKPAPVVKKPPYQASLNAWVLVRELEEDNKPVIDDTFNDDTPAQTFGDIQWDIGTDEKCESILVTVCSKCGSTVPADNVGDPALSRWAARFLKAVKGIEVGK